MKIIYAKRTHPWQMILKITADNMYAGSACQPFCNRLLD